MEGKNPNGRSSDYQQFLEYQKRYSAAKREARLLRRGGRGMAAAGLPEHPWIEASLRAKATPESPAPRRRPERVPGPSWLLGLPIVALLLVALWAPWRSHLAEGPLESPPLEVWHALRDDELEELAGLATSLSDDGLRFELVYRPDLSDALRRGVIVGELPALAIVEFETAQSLAGAGVLAPLAGSGQLLVPLAPAEPWSRPLTAVTFHRWGDDRSSKLIQEFARALAASRGSGV